MSIPVINISSLLRNLDEGSALSLEALDTCRQLVQASCGVGFFYLSGHGVSAALQKRLEESSVRFFGLDSQVKSNFDMRHGGKAWRGWFQLGDELTSGRPDQKEGFYFGTELPASHPKVQAGVPLHGPNVFPDQVVPELRPAVLEYMDACQRLAHRVLQGLAVGLMGEKHRDYFATRFADDPTCLFRIFRYPEHKFSPEADEWGVREHTDYGFLTLLKQDNSGGLEVKLPSGEWIAAPPIEDTFVVNLGDMLEIWTGGLFKATPHRVRNLAHHDRYSFPFFYDPNFDATLEVIDKSLLPPEAADAWGKKSTRWDGLDLSNVTGITYGDFLVGKVSKVFPQIHGEVNKDFKVKDVML